MDITTIAREDLADLSHFCNQNIEYDQFTPQLIEDKSFGDPHFDTENVLVGKEEGKIVAFMPGLWKQKEDRRIGWIKWFAVERERRREGIGSRLLEELEARFRKHGVQEIRISDSAPNYLQPGIDPRTRRPWLFCSRRGMRRQGISSIWRRSWPDKTWRPERANRF